MKKIIGKSLTRRIARAGERGFTLMEILVALAIVGIIVAITAAALGGRATTTRLQSVASQISQTVQGRQQLFINDLRSAHIPIAELASELGTTFANSTIIDANIVAPGIIGIQPQATSACATPGVGIQIGLVPGALTLSEAQSLQELIQSQVAEIFDGVTGDGSFTDVFNGTGQTVTGPGPKPGAAVATTPLAVHLCIGP